MSVLYICVLLVVPIWLLIYTRKFKENLVKDCGEGIFGPIHLVKKQQSGEVWLRMCGVAQGIDARSCKDRKSYWHRTAQIIVDRYRQQSESEKDFAVLYLGLGGGTIPMLVAQELPELKQVVVEIDPKVIEVVRNEFGIGEYKAIDVRQGDAFEMVKGKYDFGERFDLVMVDVFSDFQSLDKPQSTENEFVDYYAGLLKPGGQLIFNQPAHTRRARQTVSELEGLLQRKFGKLESIYVHDWARDFKNMILIV